MANTATRAEKNNFCTITFKNKEHEKFYMEYLSKCRYQDVYHLMKLEEEGRIEMKPRCPRTIKVL